MKIHIAVWLFLLLLVCDSSSSEELLKSQTSWDGGAIKYPDGPAEITSFILRLEEDQMVRYHCHPVPTMGYVLQGTVEVETIEGKKIIFKEGDSAIEVMRTVHRGHALNGPVEIIVFYAGAVDVPTTVFPEDDPEGKYCHH